jgi:hypothetical protein
MRILEVLLFGAGLLLVTSCDHDMDSGMGAMGDALAAADAENNLHHSNVLAASSQAAVRHEVGRHATAMDAIWPDMDGAMDMMSHCSSAAMADMGDMMADMQTEMDRYRGAMMAATTMAEMRTLHAEHHGYMDGTLSGMHDAMDHMGCH